MQVLKSYLKGFVGATRSPLMIVLLYAINLTVAILLAMFFYGMLKTSAGNSLETRSLLHEFNFTFWADFVNNSGEAIENVLGQIKWFVAVFWLISIFMTGGIFKTLNSKTLRIADFFAEAGQNFFRFLGTSILSLILHAITLALVYVPLYFITKALQGNFNTEKPYLIIFAVGLFIHSIIFIAILMINDYAKIYLFLKERINIFVAIWKGIKFVFSNFWQTYSLFLLLLIPPALVLYLYFIVLGDIEMSTTFGLVAMTVVQQIFIIVRIWLRVWVLSSQLEYYKAEIEEHEIERVEPVG